MLDTRLICGTMPGSRMRCRRDRCDQGSFRTDSGDRGLEQTVRTTFDLDHLRRSRVDPPTGFRRWPRRLSYNRRESTANGPGCQSTIADSVLFRTNWQPSELWDLSLLASYVRRESADEPLADLRCRSNSDNSFLAPRLRLVQLTGDARVVEVSSSVDTHRWAVTLRAARRITRRVSRLVREWATPTRRSQAHESKPQRFRELSSDRRRQV